ncbi:MAG: XRE family aerobic/anaerobic benzoate catabolism transcriptional regulator [Planctomycetota bacterium]|jgi:XRE family aerobic/anaerobic benzoate catabolism transcriptional regulator
MKNSTPNPMLVALGSRIRRLRLDDDLTQKQLSERTGLSKRFLAQLEAGQGNIALTRLSILARGLKTTLEALVSGLPDAVAAPGKKYCGVIALLGLRGAGKSSMGRELATRLGVNFVEHDDLIEEAAGMERAEIFSIHGEDYYQELARRTLDRLLAESDDTMVIATTGSLVTDAESYEQLQRRALTIWLKADPEAHWARVLAQGDFRPMRDRPDARAELERLLGRRSPLYAQAQHTLDTSALGQEASMENLMEIVTANFS